MVEGRPYRTLRPPDEIGREIERAGFRTSACRVRQNDWWDHLILVALTDDD
jgi:hypothetical protein